MRFRLVEDIITAYRGAKLSQFDSSKTQGLIWFTPQYEYAKKYVDSKGGEVLTCLLRINTPLDLRDIDINLPIKKSRDFMIILDRLGVSYSRALKLFPMIEYWTKGLWQLTNSKEFKDLIEKLGYDAVYTKEGKFDSIGVVSFSQCDIPRVK